MIKTKGRLEGVREGTCLLVQDYANSEISTEVIYTVTKHTFNIKLIIHSSQHFLSPQRHKLAR